ncbi:MAG: NAD(+)/NADH kinase [Chitinophagaceae bacterium]|jgi:diacylglycerol kinase family enzyme|nr:NAD(+)/NADH kinase [Chitinophagaceae bacterium]
MKIAKLFHNPGAGDEEHDKKNLTSMINNEGYECRYSSTKKKDWFDVEPETDFIIVAGGDGTVRDIAERLLSRKRIEKHWPIAVLPLGTANNIAKTLGVTGETKEIISSWKKTRIKKFDVGRLTGGDKTMFFLESFGYGIFPYLMMEMKKQNKEEEIEDPAKKLKFALKLMHRLILSYKPRYCHLEIDGKDHSGKFLLAEVMNTRTMGPNLCLSPDADPGDGELEVVIVLESEKDKFADYILEVINGHNESFRFQTIKAKSVSISWDGTHVHVDDEILKIEKEAPMKIELLKEALEFILPAK